MRKNDLQMGFPLLTDLDGNWLMGLVISAGEINFIIVSYDYPLRFSFFSPLRLFSGAPFYLVFDYEPITMIIPLNQRGAAWRRGYNNRLNKQPIYCSVIVSFTKKKKTMRPLLLIIHILPTYLTYLTCYPLKQAENIFKEPIETEAILNSISIFW